MPWWQAASIMAVGIGAIFTGLWFVRNRIIGSIRSTLLHPETGIINTLRIALVVPLNVRIDDIDKDRDELREETRDDIAALRDDISSLRAQVSNLMLASINLGRHFAADNTIMKQNSPWAFVDVKKLVNTYGRPPADLVEATKQILANGPLPENDDELMVRILQRVNPQRMQERADELKQPLVMYQAIYCDMLRLIKDWPGGYDRFVVDLGPQAEDGS